VTTKRSNPTEHKRGNPGRLWFALASIIIVACGDHTVPSPFSMDAGEAGAAGGPADYVEGGLNVGDDATDPTLGGPCADDGQCADDIACTKDACDLTLQRCRHTPDDSACDDGVYCNGAEVCDPKLSCHAGAPVSCVDGNPCTIDTCVEKDHSCRHDPRDADGDGDPVWNCAGGGDCDDTDPSVSSLVPEICNNGKDDNCDGKIDEQPCVAPAHDTCDQALLISGSGLTVLPLAAAALDYPTTCAPSGKNFRDLVVALSVPPGPAQDIDIVAQSSAEHVSLGTAMSCGDPASSSCSPSVTTNGGSLSRLHFYGAAPGAYTLYVAADEPMGQSADQKTDPGTSVELTVKYSDATAAPTNETCLTAAELVPNQPVIASLVGAASDVKSACYSAASADVLYAFTLDAARDVHVFANPLDSYGTPELSLRDAACTAKADELTCRVGTPASLFARALPAGRYFLSVAATGPSDISLQLEESDPSTTPDDEGCANPPPLTPAATVDLTLNDHADAVNLGCLPGAPDSTHRLTLSEPSDVLLVGGSSQADTVAVSLGLTDCAAATRLACGTSTNTLIGGSDVYTSSARAHAYGVPAGNYSVVAESAAGNPVSLTAFTRTTRPTTLVSFADDCRAPFEIPATGGHFEGNTANANADFDAGCDVGNQTQGGAPDQILHLKLAAKSRVVLDMAGSSYATMLSVRGGATCPGTELQFACAAGYIPDRSFLDLDLDSGDYYVQVDGYAGDAGAWSLDVYVAQTSL
jgi:hypothetical protein